MSDIVYPDYHNSILNLITSLLKYYSVETNHTSLEVLDKKLQNKYKNVVFIILDGMGEHILKNVSENGFFRKHEIKCITSVYPSTTTAALTTYYSGKTPLESYLKEDISGALIDVFQDVVKYEPIFEKIEKASPEVKAYEIVPDYSDRRSNRSLRANNIKEICEHIKLICSNTSQNFIMAYCDNPDGLLHKYGCDSKEAKQMIRDEAMKKELSDDTILIISADHGHRDINKVYDLLEYPELQDCLIMPASLESRTVAFWVKEDKRKKFETLFRQNFGNDFLLLSKEEVLDKHLLGYGEKHKKVDDFIGNYLALSIGDAIIRLQTFLAEGKKVKKSTHCGLTKEEMEVPLIIIE